MLISLLASLAWTAAANAGLRVTPTKTPHFLDLNLGSIEPLMGATSPERTERISELAGLVAAEAANDPTRLIVLRPSDFTLDYGRLPERMRTAMESARGSTAADAFESAIASILLSIMSEARGAAGGAQIAVFGLPMESGDCDAANHRYARVLAASSAVASSRAIIIAGSNEPEAAAMRRSLPNAIRFAGSRTILFRSNGEWRQAVEDPSLQTDLSEAAPIGDTMETDSTSTGTAELDDGERLSVSATSGEEVADAETADGASSGDSTSEKPASGSGTGSGGGGGAGGGSGGSGGGGGGVGVGGAGGLPNSGGGGGGGSSGAGSTNGDSPTPPAPEPPSSGTFPYRLYVTEDVSGSVRNLYAQNGAKDSITIYQHDIDPDDDGLFDEPEVLQAALIRDVPVNYTGPVALDWEGHGGHVLFSPINTPGREEQIQEFVRAIVKAKQVRPNAKFGFYGLPFSSLYNRDQVWHDHNASMQPIYEKSDCLFPSVYRVYPDNQPMFGAEENRLYVKESVELALELADGKPVYPYMWARFHNSNQQLGYRLIPGSQFVAHVKAIFEAKYQNRRVSGVVWWGMDRHFYWVATHYPNGGPGFYNQGPTLLQMFNAEIASGETPSQYMNRIHKRILRQMAGVIRTAPH